MRVAGRGETFLAALDRDCGTDSPPVPQLAMAHWTVVQPRFSDLLLLKMTQPYETKQSAQTEEYPRFSVGSFNAFILNANNSFAVMGVSNVCGNRYGKKKKLSRPCTSLSVLP